MMPESDRQDRELAELSARQVRRLSREITSAGGTTLATTSTGARWASEERREVEAPDDENAAQPKTSVSTSPVR